MNIIIDTHTHTVASGHAYNTITEMAKVAADKGIQLLAITEHSPAMPGTCHNFYFQNLRVVKRTMFGVQLLMGTELNIIDYDGTVDMDETTLKRMDIAIASLHTPCITPGTREQNTSALINAMKNPYVKIIGHPDDSRYRINYEELVQAAKEYHVLLELNNNSLNPDGFRVDAKKNDIEMLELCKKYQVPISLGSDAHIADDIGNTCFSEEILALTQFPDELIINTSLEKFKNFINY